MGDLTFLGPEFLTWLYFYIDQEGGEIKAGKPEARITVGKSILLKPLANPDMRVAILSPMLDDSGEVLQAIRAGAHVESMALDVVVGEHIHCLTVNGTDGSLSQVKTRYLFAEQESKMDLAGFDEPSQGPKKKKLTDEESVLIRMSALDEIEAIVDSLFQKFLLRRLGQSFVQQDLTAIRLSVAEGLKARLPPIDHAKRQPSHLEEQPVAYPA